MTDVVRSRDGARPDRRADLRDFLRSRRARLTPADVGLPAGGRRRTPGLRREEVARLAGIGLSWYTWLEQGRDMTVTARVLDSVSHALRLTEPERAHLYRLAGHAPPSVVPTGRDEIPGTMRHLLDEWMPNPAYVLDRHWRYLGGNLAVRRIFGDVKRYDSCLDGFRDAHRFRRLIANWDEIAPGLVAGLRSDRARYSDDPEFDRIVDRLRAASPEFDRLWADHAVASASGGVKEIDHPVAGRLCFDRITMHVADHAALRFVLLAPRPGTGTRRKLADLPPAGPE